MKTDGPLLSTYCVISFVIALVIENPPETLADEPVIHPAPTSKVMTGSPIPLENLVTRENWETTPEKLRWMLLHWRELHPTQAVTRGAVPAAVLRRSHQPVLDKSYQTLNGINSTFLDVAKEMEVDGLIVLHQGNIIAEHYFNGMQPQAPHFLASINKSIISTVIATLNAQGNLDLNENIDTYIQELAKTPYKGAQVRQILDMLSAIEYTYVPDTGSFAKHNQSVSPNAKFLGVPIGSQQFILALPAIADFRHGDAMFYKESDPGVLVWAAENITGQRFSDLASERLWSKIGAEFDLEASCDSIGHWTHNTCMCLRDLARWGQMLLNGGEFNGNRILPASWIKDVRENASVGHVQAFLERSPSDDPLLPTGFGYRSFFWVDTHAGNAFAAWGAFGQILYVNPDCETVVAMMSSDEDWTSNSRERWTYCRKLSEAMGQ